VIGAILVQTYLNRGLLGTDQIPIYISLAIVLGTMILEKWSLKYMKRNGCELVLVILLEGWD
jgi:hypothetical protein